MPSVETAYTLYVCAHVHVCLHDDLFILFDLIKIRHRYCYFFKEE